MARRVLLGIALALVAAGCSNGGQSAPSTTRPAAASTTTSTTAPPRPDALVEYGTGPRGECAAQVLEPAWLPDGFKPIWDPGPANADWQTAYGQDDLRIVVAGDFSGDWGDDPNLRKVTVRGHAGVLGRTEEGADRFGITWEDDPSCPAVFAVFTEGVDEAATLRLAQSLREPDWQKPDLAAQTKEARRRYVGRRYTIRDSTDHLHPQIVFRGGGLEAIWLAAQSTQRDATGARSLDEVHDGVRRMIFFGKIEGKGARSQTPSLIWDVLVIDFDARFGCVGANGSNKGPLFGRVAPGTSDPYQVPAQPVQAWRGELDSHTIDETDVRSVRCDGPDPTDFGPYADLVDRSIAAYGDCQTPTVEPRRLILACADHNSRVEDIDWSSWTARGAAGSGTYVYNDCTPDCAGGTMQSVPRTTVFLSKAVRGANGQMVWSEVKLLDNRSSPVREIGPFALVTRPV